ncbi:antibiotic biosynthesis monooxygenase [Streptomyces actinomycinicus]|uniref:Antibiotic biosynthesis monooxygenase n=1 Tax=Streptomyces actinomycinicus TaxID=1695166 RepID=A0A937EJE2_9ACTN|nr:antibiotic biosynthesis monooxygenase [Streptomyces actinomycinicus]MBL1083355.1 antibiotic biosynthesis monooxygenase [Streptomyces actinomycinicus]
MFTATRTDDDTAGYGTTAEHLSRLVRDVPGFLGEDAAHTPGGLSISVAYFRDLAGIEHWRRHPEHVDAKSRGREQWYERYVIHIARVEHSHAFTRP